VKATIQRQSRLNGVTAVTLTHAATGYQLQITPGRHGFVIHSAEGVTFRRYDDLAYEVEPDEHLQHDQKPIQA
jgi:hypothetical protein